IPTVVWEAAGDFGADGRLYIFGGEEAPTALQIYTPSSNSWTTGPVMPAARLLHKVARGSDNRLYIFGGTPGYAGPAASTGDIYTTSSQTYRTPAGMPQATVQFGLAASDARTYIYFAGGSTEYLTDAPPYFSDVWRFNVTTQNYSPVTSLP